MQDIIEELIRGIGYVALRVVTFLRYRGGRQRDRLPEGAIGLGIVVVVAYVLLIIRACPVATVCSSRIDRSFACDTSRRRL